MRVTLISGVNESNNVIGINGKLPWRNPSDLKAMVRAIGSHVVLMGRGTYDELTIPIGEGTNYVLSNTLESVKDGFVIVRSIEEFLSLCDEDFFVCGGENLYRYFLENHDDYEEMDVIIHYMEYGNIKGDRHFPMELLDTNIFKTDYPYVYRRVTSSSYPDVKIALYCKGAN